MGLVIRWMTTEKEDKTYYLEHVDVVDQYVDDAKQSMDNYETSVAAPRYEEHGNQYTETGTETAQDRRQEKIRKFQDLLQKEWVEGKLATFLERRIGELQMKTWQGRNEYLPDDANQDDTTENDA